MYYIMIDNMDWNVDVGPTHILDKNYNFLPVYLGRNIYEDEMDEDVEPMCVVCISNDDYIMVDHGKPYVFIHEVDTEPSFDSLSGEIKEHISEMYKIVVEDTESMSREHTHIMSYVDEDDESNL